MNTLLTTVLDRSPGWDAVRARGEVDLGTVPVLRDALLSALDVDPSPGLLVVDLTGVSFMGSVGLTVLVEAGERATSLERDLIVVATPGGVVRRAIEITGLDQALAIADDVDQATAGR
ncbi:STAS domain-containing protein [Actinokineospora auranticolor]|uniref:Anti-sigma factor antagonist n=1 Tax=Actinokineospora auranticolor TaxID=155976 RepID=A0A2S6GCR6_9PSEU|nr:STAS domain-containing protein [Actinokineospora auranticolor]PPK62070.1 anti-anti-sigma factor [Actinokineospora auranticolor]